MKIIDIIIKDLKLTISDKSAVAILIVMPIVLMTILGYSLTFSFKDFSSMGKIEIAIVKEYQLKEEKKALLDLIPRDSNINIQDIDFDGFDMEKLFFEDFLGNDEIKNIVNYGIMTRDEAVKKLNDKEIAAIVVLPEGFIKDTMVNFGTTFRNIVNIEIIGRTDKNIGTTIVEEIIKGFSDIITYNVSAKNSFSRLYVRENIEGNIYDHIKPLIDRITKVIKTERPELEYEPLNNRPPMNSRAYYAFAMTAMFILYGVLNGSKLLLEEKDMGTYDRMSASGVGKWQIVIGKSFSIFLFTLIQLIITYIYSSLVLSVNWGNEINLLAIFIVSAFSIAALSTMLSVIVYKIGSYNVANVLTSIIIQIMAALGGSLIPLELLPAMARSASYFTLNGLVLKALMKNYYGYGINTFAVYLFVLIGLGLLFIIIAVYLLKKEQGGSKNYVKRSNAKANAV